MTNERIRTKALDDHEQLVAKLLANDGMQLFQFIKSQTLAVVILGWVTARDQIIRTHPMKLEKSPS